MRNILVIDDEEVLSRTLSRALNRIGFNVDTAKDGTEGIVKFNNEIFDLVMTDIRMPGADGIDVVRHIRDSLRKTTPVVGISGTPWLLEKGEFDVVLPKPFSLKALTDTVRSLIGTTLMPNTQMDSDS